MTATAPVRDVGVVIVAAGAGHRARTGDASGELKQFRWVAGKPVLLHSLQAFHARADVAMVVCVLPREAAGDPPPWIFQCDTERLLVTAGGATRAESVRNGLEDLPAGCTVALIHDAARPLATDAMIGRVVEAARAGTGAIAALPVVDTLKEVGPDGMVIRTIDRSSLWRAQTPQGFPREMILKAHSSPGAGAATDDAALCERLGLPVRVVYGSERAMKITDPADFARAEALSTLRE
ncbi:MAG: 2-C-methyl-D-erythritol 4-phosphate cytidylyltransferase [Gemmatimonadetes bacterium]|nr:2-C-methyl-D-erythritol 4-phosphate cytidylyltransferase [Gemmatimonadota bacterium]